MGEIEVPKLDVNLTNDSKLKDAPEIEKVETINLGGHSDVPGDAVMIIKASIKD